MIRSLESIMIGSQSAKKLANFYKDKVGLKFGMVAQMGDKGEELYELKVGKGPNIYIMDHSKVKGTNKNPDRIILNLEVDDIEKEVARMKKAKVRPIKDTYHVEGYCWISTFKDVDGNYFQFVQVRAK